ncbi:nmrA-like family protein [Colletotrichum plurivorum]|uniref:NmrA-like family protein n=1 Tax=Colletotrichum plurivorum TaxID=2175906 RepID=A0A8H6N285_9PEZI|nr:nmrA-like family protein [Colletotrichum plurivorum]
MVVVAVAGGTGGIGRAVVEQLQLSQKHDVVVLSRKIPDGPPPSNARIVKVDYDDVEGLRQLLESENVETVISTISILSAAQSQAQLNLIAAADSSSSTRRFVPSEFGTMNAPEDAAKEPVMAPFASTADVLKGTKLQYTRFVLGFLMDYWGMPHVPSYMEPMHFAFDMVNRRGVIPGSGNDVISLVHSFDLARFIVQSLDSDDWPEYSGVVGSDITLNEALALIEKARGGKFDVVHDDDEKLKSGDATLLGNEGAMPVEIIKEMNAFFGRLIVGGLMHIPKAVRITDKYADIRPMTVGEILEKAAAKVDV